MAAFLKPFEAVRHLQPIAQRVRRHAQSTSSLQFGRRRTHRVYARLEVVLYYILRCSVPINGDFINLFNRILYYADVLLRFYHSSNVFDLFLGQDRAHALFHWLTSSFHRVTQALHLPPHLLELSADATDRQQDFQTLAFAMDRAARDDAAMFRRVNMLSGTDCRRLHHAFNQLYMNRRPLFRDTGTVARFLRRVLIALQAAL